MDALDATPLCPSPRELRLEQVEFEAGQVLVKAAARRRAAACPICGQWSRRVHSRYHRTLADLPWHGLQVRLQLSVRKFFCDTPTCPRRIFTERLPATAMSYARRTMRAAEILRAIGLALGGAPGARLAAVLGVTASATTVLHRIRSTPLPKSDAPRVVGIDDWAWRKGLVYGSIVVDLERGKILDLLPDRERETVIEWLRAHPGIEVISRDRSESYAEAARLGAPTAMQVADRFHLVKNLGDAVQRLLSQHANQLRDVAREMLNPATVTAGAGAPAGSGLAAAPVNTAEDQSAFNVSAMAADERESVASRERRRDRYAQVIELRQHGATMQQIAIKLHMSIGTVHRWLHSEGFPERARQRRSADKVADQIRERWAAGCHSAAAIWQALHSAGFAGSKRTVQREVTRLGLDRAGANAPRPASARPPSPRHLAWLFGQGCQKGTVDTQRFIETLCARAPALAQVRDLARQFVEMARTRDSAHYDAWLTAAEKSELRGFVRGLRSDDAAVRAAFSTRWSNGPTEGHIHRLKLLKRTMYGRAKMDLLRIRLLATG